MQPAQAKLAAIICLSALALAVPGARADETSSGPSPYAQQGERQDQRGAIDFSTDDAWAGRMLVAIIGGLFVPAILIGPWIRKRVADELPELHGGEEQSAFTASQHEPGHTRPVSDQLHN
jgi:hypothetical protein